MSESRRKRSRTMDEIGETSGVTTWGDIWQDYCDHSTIPGIRQIGQDTPFPMRRCIWGILLIGGCIGFVYQTFACVAMYLSFPKSTNVHFKQLSSIAFPSITICNLNKFRNSVAAENSFYHTINTVFTHSALSPLYPDLHQNPLNKTIQITRDRISGKQTVDKIFLQSAHSKEDLIVSCSFSGQKCSSSDFKEIHSAEGVCFTFADNKYRSKVLRQGVHQGLRLLLNVEKYEYMGRLTEATGVRVSAHSPQQQQPESAKQFVLGPGQHAFVELQMTQIKHLDKPFGDCRSTDIIGSNYSRIACQNAILASDVASQCKCTDFWMSERTEYEICNVSAYLKCVQPLYNSEQTTAQLDCPVACQETIFDPFISTIPISNTYVTSILSGNHSQFLRKKLIKAREAFEHFDYEQHRRNKIIITEFTSALRQIKEAYTKIMDQTAMAMSFVKDSMNEVTSRLNFHLQYPLHFIKQMIEVNFVRGWKITDERTLTRVTSKFYETISMYDKTVSKILALSKNDQQNIRILYMMMERDLSEQLELAIRAVDNLTRVHYAFKDGRSFNWFDITPNGEYDDYLIPTSTLGHSQQKQKKYYNALSDHLTGYIEELLAMEAILKDVYQTSYLNNTAYIRSRDNFSEHSRQINHYRILFYEEVVLKAVELWNMKIQEFTNLNMSYNLQKYNILKSIVHLNQTANSALENLNNNVLPVVAKLLNYIKDVSLSKFELANDILSGHFHDIFTKSVQNPMEALKSYGRDLDNSWHGLKATIIHIWEKIISDTATKGFYNAVMEDLVSQSVDLNFSQPILEMAGIWGLEYNTSSISYEKLIKLLNADISGMVVQSKKENATKELNSYAEKTDVLRTLNNLDVKLLEAFKILQNDLKYYRESTDVSDTFVRENFIQLELYQTNSQIIEVSEVPSYTLVSLLGDVGGSLALFLGMSILTVCELLDFVLHGSAYYQDAKRQNKQRQQVHYHYYDTTDDSRASSKSQTGNGQPSEYKLASGDSYV